MTTRSPTRDDETAPIDQQRAVEALREALETDELDEKDYQIREALQLLALTDD